MKYCVSCGKPMEDNAAFCGACGTPVEAVQSPAAVAEPAVTPVVTDAPKPRRNIKSLVFSIVGLALGGISLFFSSFGLLFAMGMVEATAFYTVYASLFAVPGLIFSNLAKADVDRGRAKAGKIMNIVTLIVAGVAMLLCILASVAQPDTPTSFLDFLEWLD